MVHRRPADDQPGVVAVAVRGERLGLCCEANHRDLELLVWADELFGVGKQPFTVHFGHLRSPVRLPVVVLVYDDCLEAARGFDCEIRDRDVHFFLWGWGSVGGMAA